MKEINSRHAPPGKRLKKRWRTFLSRFLMARSLHPFFRIVIQPVKMLPANKREDSVEWRNSPNLMPKEWIADVDDDSTAQLSKVGSRWSFHALLIDYCHRLEGKMWTFHKAAKLFKQMNPLKLISWDCRGFSKINSSSLPNASAVNPFNNLQ